MQQSSKMPWCTTKLRCSGPRTTPALSLSTSTRAREQSSLMLWTLTSIWKERCLWLLLIYGRLIQEFLSSLQVVSFYEDFFFGAIDVNFDG
mmetsp:Transcript_76124/g.139281  ORF Transcript_76124/g.139281 Transcript_76124/m.139281 type:complete len:91 (+) Transcript_76124:663-935(+)